MSMRSNLTATVVKKHIITQRISILYTPLVNKITTLTTVESKCTIALTKRQERR
jgi:hypothetical protein